LPPGEGDYSRPPSERAQKSLIEQLHEVRQQERAEARARQKKAGIKNPIQTGFSRDLDPEVDGAMERIWQAGQWARKLYVSISKGLASMTRADVLALAQCKPAEIEAVAPALVRGLTLREASNETDDGGGGAGAAGGTGAEQGDQL